MEHLDIEHLERQFQNHLIDNNNHKILLSAKFGTGKTYFLKHFFKIHEKEYKPFFVTPLLYQVFQNEDIFKYIEYELLLQIITTSDNLINTSHFNKEDIGKYVDGILQGVSKVLTGLTPIQVDKIYNGFSKIIKAGKELKKSNPVDIRLNSIKESQIVEKIINDEIKKNQKTEKKTSILIIDDLDRLYPEHIFRILNIISAYQIDVNNGANEEPMNRLGFDKTIVVCDINNLSSIYKHKFGKQADFDGYINKFYSKEVFFLTIEYQRNVFITNELQKAGIPARIIEGRNTRNNKDFDFLKSYYNTITDFMIQQNIFSIRNLTKNLSKLVFSKSEFIEKYNQYLSANKIPENHIEQSHINVLCIFNYIVQQSGGYEMFLKNFEILKELKPEEIVFKNIIWRYFTIIDAINELWKTEIIEGENESVVINSIGKMKFHFNLNEGLKLNYGLFNSQIYSSMNDDKDNISFYNQIKKSISILKRIFFAK